MLIKTTAKCSMGCSHCFEHSTIRDPHMSRFTFDAALKFVLDVESLAHKIGYKYILLSGGECTENPEIIEFIRMVYAVGLEPILITNGMWLNDEKLKAEILAFKKMTIQVTNDPRFYPKAPPRVDDPRIVYVDHLSRMLPLGRFSTKEHPDIPTRLAPTSFNFRSITRAKGDIRQAIAMLRMNTMSGGLSGHCSPSISHDGSFVAGETRYCFNVGNIFMPAEIITRNVLAMHDCNRCGLEKGLSPLLRAAIGLEPNPPPHSH